MNIRNKIGSKIRQLREDANLTQEQLAENAGVGLRTITNIESGAFNARIDIIDKIAQALNSSVEIICFTT